MMETAHPNWQVVRLDVQKRLTLLQASLCRADSDQLSAVSVHWLCWLL